MLKIKDAAGLALVGLRGRRAFNEKVTDYRGGAADGDEG